MPQRPSGTVSALWLLFAVLALLGGLAGFGTALTIACWAGALIVALVLLRVSRRQPQDVADRS